MRIWSDVLAFRCSRHEEDKDDTIEGVPWGTTIIGFDDGNGWVHVPGSGYLPKVLEGMPVLITGVTEGPALTADGLALDMDEGAPQLSILRSLSSLATAVRVFLSRWTGHEEQTQNF